MNVVWIIDPKTQETFAIRVEETSQEALEYKEGVVAENPDIICYYSVGINIDLDQDLYDINEVIENIRGN